MRYPLRWTLAAHLGGWLLFLGLILVFSGNGPAPGTFLFVALFAALFYGHAYGLFPKLFLRKRYVPYFCCLLLLAALVLYVQPFDRFLKPDGAGFGRPGPGHAPPADMRPPPGRRGPRVDIISLVLFVMTASFGAALQIARQWRLTERRALQAEAERSRAELSFLRAQISPHFLFNTLNNIYSLSVAGNGRAPEAILQLAHILRYVTEEAPSTLVSLDQEAACIQDYIDLQQLRLREGAGLSFQISGNLGAHEVPPLLLMTFVENVFKYGISAHEQPQIDIRVDAAPGRIRFRCSNRIFRREDSLESSGIGIRNARQRLAHAYPGRHRLDVQEAEGWFHVDLLLEDASSNPT